MDETDFRVRSAQRKRQKMRARLLTATMDVCGGAGAGAGNPAVIDDVIRAAGVSRGTFYKYFASLEEARLALGQHLTNELVEGLASMFDQVRDPVRRTASGWIVIMLRAAFDPAWGAFVVRTEHFTEDSELLAAVRRNTLAGMDSGAFQLDRVDAAVDYQIGVAMEGMRRLISDGTEATAYVATLTALGLRGLGLDGRRARGAAAAALQDVTTRAPQFLPWWRS
ncbi:MAG: TetR/AcrR family transcriptional regulator [Pseudomonadales bacterium]